MRSVEDLHRAARDIIAASAAPWAITSDLTARVVQTVFLTDDWRTGFFTGRTTRKVLLLKRNASLTLAYHATEEGSYVTVHGKAEVTEDKERKRAVWQPSLDRWYPDGPADPDLALIELSAQHIEIWSASRGIMPGTGAVILTRGADGWTLGSSETP
ncbi:MAG: pyridoxamine 5'-phosphate oxidase family protein [Paracoccaceae bacterium]